MPPTSASLPRVSFFFSFFVTAAIDSTNEANKVPLSSLYSLDVHGRATQEQWLLSLVAVALDFANVNTALMKNRYLI